MNGQPTKSTSRACWIVVLLTVLVLLVMIWLHECMTLGRHKPGAPVPIPNPRRGAHAQPSHTFRERLFKIAEWERHV